MTTVIDERGNLFGYVNVIDFLALLVTVSIIIAGVAYVGGYGSPAPKHEQLRFKTTVLPSQADAIQNRRPYGGEVIAIDSAEVIGEEISWENGETVDLLHMRLVVTLPVTQTDKGLYRYEGQRTLIGGTYQLDLGYTIVDAVLIGGLEVENA